MAGTGVASLRDADRQWSELQRDIPRIPYLNDAALEFFYTQSQRDLTQSEILVGLIHLAHQKLLKQDALGFIRDQLVSAARRYPDLGLSIVNFFTDRFDPDRKSASTVTISEARIKIDADTENFEDGKILETLLDAANAVLKTNMFVSSLSLAKGEPSSKIIVEVANLFITPEARCALSGCGVIIVKDSSANKCGVICSSLEIIAGMLFSEEKFWTIKDRFVQEVLIKLRKLAELEVKCLFLECRHKPHVSRPELSIRLSQAIITATDAVAEEVHDLAAQNPALVADLG